MADFTYQYLKHGKALCGAVFGTFVETFNRLVSRAENMKGDADGTGDGYITVDNADPDHLVIRFDATKIASNADGGDGDKDPDEDEDEDGEDEEEAACVTSINGAKGDVSVIGGERIEVSTDGQTIKVSYNADKEDEDEDPNAGGNPCDHDGFGGAGGGVEGGDDGGGGGVAADGDIHPGDSGCNCE